MLPCKTRRSVRDTWPSGFLCRRSPSCHTAMEEHVRKRIHFPTVTTAKNKTKKNDSVWQTSTNVDGKRWNLNAHHSDPKFVLLSSLRKGHETTTARRRA